MTLGDYGISALLGKIVDFIYLFVNGFVDYAGDLSSIIVLGVLVGLIVVVIVSLTDGGKKALGSLMSLGKVTGRR